jgi:hypothetical protein
MFNNTIDQLFNAIAHSIFSAYLPFATSIGEDIEKQCRELSTTTNKIMNNFKLNLLNGKPDTYGSNLNLSIIGIVLFFLSFFFFTFSNIAWVTCVKSILQSKLLRHYYSETQIQKENLKIIDVKYRIEISNGDILPDFERIKYYEAGRVYWIPYLIVSMGGYLYVLYNIQRIDNYIINKACLLIGIKNYLSQVDNETSLLQEIPSVSGDSKIYKNESYQLQLHSNGADVLRWEIDWDDGTSSTISDNAEFALHCFSENRTYNIVIKSVVKVVTPLSEFYETGFSADYWRSHLDEWQIDSTRNYETIFGVPAFMSVGSLLDAIICNDNSRDSYDSEIKQLWRESTAAILNASSSNVRYKYTLEEVIDVVQKAYQSGQYAMYAEMFKSENSHDKKNLTNNTKEQQEKIFNMQKTVKQL